MHRMGSLLCLFVSEDRMASQDLDDHDDCDLV